MRGSTAGGRKKLGELVALMTVERVKQASVEDRSMVVLRDQK